MCILSHVLFLQFNILYLCTGPETSVIFWSICPWNWPHGSFHVKWTKFSAFRSQNENFHMWGQDNEQFWWFFFQKFKKVGFFLKIQISKIFWIEDLWKLVVRLIKLKLLTKASISCLWPILCQLQLDLRVFSQLHVCEKLCYKWKTTTYTIMKICSFSYPPVVLQVYQVWMKSELGWFFQSFTWHGMTRMLITKHINSSSPHCSSLSCISTLYESVFSAFKTQLKLRSAVFSG
jgi:hypothetical protein